MSDHNFEKEVQQKLDGLKIPPADKVWAAVEAEVRKDKRRRRGLIFFPILFLMLGAGSYFIFQDRFFSTAKNTPPTTSVKSNAQEDKIPAVKIPQEQADQDPLKKKRVESTDQSGTIVNQDKQSNKTQIESTIRLNKVNNRKTDLVIVSNPETVSRKQEQKKNVGLNNREQQNQNDPHDKNITGQTGIAPIISEKIPDPLIDRNQKSEAILPPDNLIASSGDTQSNKPSNGLVVNQVDDSISNADLTKENTIEPLISDRIGEQNNIPGKKIKHPSWKWGLDASAGISNLSEGNFFDGVLSGDKSLVADVSGPSPSSPNTSGPPVIVPKPSAFKKGFSFTMGAFIEKNLSGRYSISTGIRYSHYSNRIQVGTRVNTATSVQLQNAFGAVAVTQYYRSAPVTATHSYTNRFHFIELPVSFHAVLNKSKRLPLVWNTGLTLGYLVSTNVLHFDGQTGVYYKDNGLLNKLQANLSTGFSLSLFNRSRTPVDIGPQLQYGFTNLMKREVSASKHLVYFGVNTKLFLRK